MEEFNTKDFLFTILSRAGRSKDEVIQILGKEIGSALAAMLKKPLSELVKHNRLQITVELVSKSHSKASTRSHKKTAK